MQIQKMITKVEKLKAEVASIQKEVQAEAKRGAKALSAANKKMAKLRDKRSAMTPEQRGDVMGIEKSAAATKLDKEIDDLHDKICSMEDGNALGFDGDTGADESIIGAFDSIGYALDELVKGKGKKRKGLLPEYERQLAEASA